jgi:hypothetical protein
MQTLIVAQILLLSMINDLDQEQNRMDTKKFHSEWRLKMKIVNGIATSPIAGKLMSALQHSNSPKLQKIWKEKIQERKQKEIPASEQN